MLDKKTFDKCFNAMLYLGSVAIDTKKNEAFYQFLKNDFTDEDFPRICKDICQNESFFGKYPEPKMFFDRKKENGDVLVVEGKFYLDDTMPEYREYLIGMSDEDVEKVWKWIIDNKYGETVSKEWVIERIKQFRKPVIEEIPTLKLQNLTNVIKRI